MKKITTVDLKKSKSSLAIAQRGMATKQLTENSAIFDNILQGVDLHLSLFFKDKAPVNFDVRKWYDNKSYEHKLALSKLMKKAVLSRNAISNMSVGKKIVRLLTSDIYKGEDQNIISYFFAIEYKADEVLKTMKISLKTYDFNAINKAA